MKVLLVHNFYGSAAASGENQVFEAERALVRSHGHEVAEFVRHSDEIRRQGAWGMVKGAAATPWNPWMAAAIRRKVEDFRPDVVHVHNTFPLLSPAIFYTIGDRAARVLTLHNYRIFCPAAIPIRNGRVCTECIDYHSVIPAIRYGCYQGSRTATLPLALNVALHRWLGTWTGQVDAFIALTEFQRELMIQAGLPEDHVYVKPNFYPGNPATVPWKERDKVVIFAGRLTPEKGVKTLIRAWQLWGEGAPELRILGDGPLRGELERLAKGEKINFLGQLSSQEAQNGIARAKLLVLPSAFEGSPMVIQESFAFGTPVAVFDIRPLRCIIRHGVNGVVVEVANADSLFREVRTVWESPGLLERLSEGARLSFEETYNEEANYRIHMSIYNQAIATMRQRAA